MMVFSVFWAMESIIDGRERPEVYLEGHKNFEGIRRAIERL